MGFLSHREQHMPELDDIDEERQPRQTVMGVTSTINDRQYLENALKPQRSFTSEAASRNQIRTLLGSFFRERDCVTLVRPAEDEATLKKLSQVPVSSLRPEFQRGLANLKDKVYAQTRAKSVNGRALSGAMLATLAKTYADAWAMNALRTTNTVMDHVPVPQGENSMFTSLKVWLKMIDTASSEAILNSHGLSQIQKWAQRATVRQRAGTCAAEGALHPNRQPRPHTLKRTCHHSFAASPAPPP